MVKPLTLSVIIPAYNEESYLKSCLEAIASQTVRPDEVIVVDNNSTDKTAQIARSFAFVHLIKEKRQGLYYSRQTGMDTAKSDIIARIDADTFIERDWVAQVKKAFQDPAIQAMTGPFAYHDMPLPEVGQLLDRAARWTVLKGGYQFLAGANMAIRQSAWHLVAHELCNEPFLFEDSDIVQHLSHHGITPVYNVNMRAAMSSRRYADKPSDFVRYIGGHSRTLVYHNQPVPWGAHFAEGIFSLGYLILKPLHHTFDPIKRRPSLSYLLQKTEARPDPMAAERA